MTAGRFILTRMLMRRVSGKFWLRWFSLVLIGVICFTIVFVTVADKRTFSVVARSLGGEITFQGELNDWLIERGSICKLRDLPDLRIPPTEDASPCDPRIYTTTVVTDYALEWRDGTVVTWKRHASGALQFSMLEGTSEEMEPGSLLVISDIDWRNHGALAFQGVVRIGSTIATGSDDYLLEGSWQALQSGLAASLFRDVTDVVQSGSLSRGLAVDFHRLGSPKDTDEETVISYGHLTPADGDEKGAIIALLTEHAPVSLRINYFGLREPALFRPDWIDTISSSTMLVAIAVIFSLLLGILELLNAIALRWNGNSQNINTSK